MSNQSKLLQKTRFYLFNMGNYGDWPKPMPTMVDREMKRRKTASYRRKFHQQWHRLELVVWQLMICLKNSMVDSTLLETSGKCQ